MILNSSKKLCAGLIALSFLFLTINHSNADVIISNLPGNDLASTFINAPSGGSNGGTQWDSKAAGFTMGATSYELENVQLRLQFFADWTRADPTVGIYDDNGGVPDNALMFLDDPAFAQGIGTYTFTPGGSLTLEANETYWIVVTNRALVPNSFVWLASDPGVEPTGIASNAGYLFDYNQSVPETPSNTLNSYAVNGNAIPEPSSLVVLALGACTLCLRRKR